jgi:hypothetical protein
MFAWVLFGSLPQSYGTGGFSRQKEFLSLCDLARYFPGLPIGEAGQAFASAPVPPQNCTYCRAERNQSSRNHALTPPRGFLAVTGAAQILPVGTKALPGSFKSAILPQNSPEFGQW